MSHRRDEDFREFVLACSPDLLRLARTLTGDRHAAEDLLQQTLLKSWSHWRRISEASHPSAYVRQMLTNNYIRSRRRFWTRETPTDVVPERTEQDVGHAVVTRLGLAEQLRQLPARQQAAVVLRYYEDLDDATIANILGCTEGTVRSQISRALNTLRVHERTARSEGAAC
ncbi:MAG: SigE family RNA polymerase sigma factor [Frankiales bacterium]|nr:SigE family RNA polymerase sigma factor [Frankiales bacterium]